MAGELMDQNELWGDFPRELKIGGKTFSIKYLGELGMGVGMGEVDFFFQKIKILRNCRDVMRDTLLHEIFHILLFVNGMESEGIKGEVVVNMLAHGLDAVFIDNPKLVRLYAKKGRKNHA